MTRGCSSSQVSPLESSLSRRGGWPAADWYTSQSTTKFDGKAKSRTKLAQNLSGRSSKFEETSPWHERHVHQSTCPAARGWRRTQYEEHNRLMMDVARQLKELQETRRCSSPPVKPSSMGLSLVGPSCTSFHPCCCPTLPSLPSRRHAHGTCTFADSTRTHTNVRFPCLW